MQLLLVESFGLLWVLFNFFLDVCPRCYQMNLCMAEAARKAEATVVTARVWWGTMRGVAGRRWGGGGEGPCID